MVTAVYRVNNKKKFTGSKSKAKRNPGRENEDQVIKDKQKGFRILIADDELGITKYLDKLLRMKGYSDIVVVNSGLEAIDQLKAKFFDLVFLDMLLTDISGYKILEEIHLSQSADKVVVMTGRMDMEEKELKKLGTYALLHKPFTLNQVLGIVAKAAR